MRLIRSLYFGGFAMLAAAMFFSMPASALDRQPIFSSASYEMPDFALFDVLATEPVVAEAESLPAPSANAHAVEFASQNQPLSPWRIAVDAYSRIDPHIVAG